MHSTCTKICETAAPVAISRQRSCSVAENEITSFSHIHLVSLRKLVEGEKKKVTKRGDFKGFYAAPLLVAHTSAGACPRDNNICVSFRVLKKKKLTNSS